MGRREEEEAEGLVLALDRVHERGMRAVDPAVETGEETQAEHIRGVIGTEIIEEAGTGAEYPNHNLEGGFKLKSLAGGGVSQRIVVRSARKNCTSPVLCDVDGVNSPK